jgi:integrase
MAKHRGIYKRGCVWWYRYADASGKIARMSSFSKKQADAVELRSKATLAVRDGKEPEAPKNISSYSFYDLAEKYLSWIAGQQASADLKGYIIDRLKEREIVLPGDNGDMQTVKLGPLPLRRFNYYLIEQLQTDLKRKELRAPRKNSKRVKDSTAINGLKDSGCNRILSTIKHMFSKAVEWDMVEETTLKKIRKIKLPKEVGRLRYLFAKEAQALVSVCETQLQPIVITALHTGMRKGEILKLKWDNVDMHHGFILLDKTKNGERREIPINNTLRETQNKLPRNFTGEKENRKLVPYVFHDPGTFKPYGGMKHSFNTAVKNAGFTDFHFQDLRHTFASLAMMSGKIDIATLSKILGHKSLKQKMKYTHLAPPHLQKAVFVMDEVYRVSTDTKLAQSNEKGSADESQPLDKLVELRGIEPLTPRLPALCSPS